MSEIEPGAGDDQTTDAILSIIQTLGGADSTNGDNRLTFRVPDGEDALSVADRNSQLQEQLSGQGLLRRVSPAQSRLLGCIGCKLQRSEHTPEGETAELRTTEIAQCAGVTFDPARRLLDDLSQAGLLDSEVKRTTGRGVNAPTRWFTLSSQARINGFADSLAMPEECGLDDEARARLRQRPKRHIPLVKMTNDDTNREAEQFLIDKKIFQARSGTRRAALGCLACQLSRSTDGVFGLQVARCQGITHTTPGLIFTDLEKQGIVTSDFKDGRVLFRLSLDNHLGRGLDRLLEVPQQCGLERTMEAEA